MNRLKLTIALAAMAIFTTANAHASLLGDNVTLNIYNNNTLETSTPATVSAAVEYNLSSINNIFFPGEIIDLTSNSINLGFSGGVQRSFEITGIDEPVIGVTSSTSGSTISNLSFTVNSVRFLYVAGNVASTGTVNLTFASANEPQVPEPGTTALLVSGLAGIFFYRRKR